MELKVKELSFSEVVIANFDELKQQLQEKAKQYESHIYTEGQVSGAKKDLAMLRKFTKALSDERIRIKKECLKPYEEFEAKIKELDAIVQEPISQIDKQVKFFEEETKAAKKKDIEEMWKNTEIQLPIPLTLEQIFNEKWLNVSVKMPAIEKEIYEKLQQIKNELETLSNLPDFAFEAIEVYKTTLDINKAISEGKRLAEIQKRKAEAEAKALEEAGITPEELKEAREEYIAAASANGVPVMRPVENVNKSWISFRAFLSVEQAAALKQFFDDRNIVFEKI